MSINIKWDGDCRFKVSTEGGFTFNVDATSETAPCPTEVLLSALGSCSATDVSYCYYKIKVLQLKA